MKTEYVILWVDDELDSVETDLENVRDFLESKGIKANIITVDPNDDEDIDVHTQISDTLQNPNLDLIVVDFLMDGMDGKVLIDLIRQSDHVYLPVVFYSSVGLDGLMEAVKDAKLDGVYLANRDVVSRKIETVVNSLLVKEQTSKRTRGLLMEGVSEIDANFGTIFSKIWDLLSAEQRASLINYFYGKIEERARYTMKAKDSFPKIEQDFWEHIQVNFVSGAYDTMTRWKVLKKGLKLIQFNPDCCKVFDELNISREGNTTLIDLRNNYAHKTREELEIEHSEELCIQIRRELRRQSDNLKSIEANM